MSSYSLAAYGLMADDAVRMGAYVEAMRRSIRPGDIVLDIGTGPGVMALMACQMGASRVYALETNGSIEMARLAAARNGYANKICFLKKLSSEIDLPEVADVMGSDLRGQSPLHKEHIPSIVDARARLLKPGGIQLPARDQLFVGLSRDDVAYRGVRRPWLENDFGLDLSDGFVPVVNSIHRNSQRTNISLGTGQVWAEIDYTRVQSADVKGLVTFDLPRGEGVNGLELWFEAEVCEGVRYNTGPGQPEQVYGRTWLPLARPITADEGSRLVVDLSMNLVDGDYVICWKTSLYAGGGSELLWTQSQSTFHNAMLSPTRRALMNPQFQPKLTEQGEVLFWLLGQFSGEVSVGALASALLHRFPKVVRNLEHANVFVRGAASNFGISLELGRN